MKKNSTGYTINRENKTIVMTKAFAKQANIYGTQEYKILVAMLHDLDGYTATTKTIRRNSSKKSYRGLSYENMEIYIKAKKDDKALIEFENVCELSKIQSGSYA